MCVFGARHLAQTAKGKETAARRKGRRIPQRGQEEAHVEASEEEEDVKQNCARRTRSASRKADRKRTTRKKANNSKTNRHSKRARRKTTNARFATSRKARPGGRGRHSYTGEEQEDGHVHDGDDEQPSTTQAQHNICTEVVFFLGLCTGLPFFTRFRALRCPARVRRGARVPRGGRSLGSADDKEQVSNKGSKCCNAALSFGCVFSRTRFFLGGGGGGLNEMPTILENA